jgi:hypothetical protein
VFGALLFALMATLATSLQLLIDDQSRGRVMALYVLCWGGLVPIGGLLLGVLAQVWGAGAALVAFGCVTAGYGAFVGLAHRRKMLLATARIPLERERIASEDL